MASSGGESRVERIPNPVHGSQDVHPGPFEFPAQSTEKSVDDIAAGRLSIPDRVENHRAGTGLARVAHEEFKEFEFPA